MYRLTTPDTTEDGSPKIAWTSWLRYKDEASKLQQDLLNIKGSLTSLLAIATSCVPFVLVSTSCVLISVQRSSVHQTALQIPRLQSEIDSIRAQQQLNQSQIVQAILHSSRREEFIQSLLVQLCREHVTNISAIEVVEQTTSTRGEGTEIGDTRVMQIDQQRSFPRSLLDQNQTSTLSLGTAREGYQLALRRSGPCSSDCRCSCHRQYSRSPCWQQSFNVWRGSFGRLLVSYSGMSFTARSKCNERRCRSRSDTRVMVLVQPPPWLMARSIFMVLSYSQQSGPELCLRVMRTRDTGTDICAIVYARRGNLDLVKKEISTGRSSVFDLSVVDGSNALQVKF